jgi:hypothetical protein
LPERATRGQTRGVITNVYIHLINELPLLVDVLELPGPTDRNLRCTNVRTVDGKRPTFVHDPRSTFVFPMSVVRMIEAPSMTHAVADTDIVPVADEVMTLPPPLPEEEPDEDLLARIRSV